MSASETPSVALVGELSLLTLCGDHLLERGWTVGAVCTRSNRVQEWARANDIRVLNSPRGLIDLPIPFDYLFSITNFAIIEPAVLSSIRRLSINFHDGPLPEMGGLNVPAWALAEGRTEFAISWHVITDRVDEGGLLLREPVALAPSETQLSLNTKCFEAGLISFRRLISGLEQGTLTEQPSREVEAYYPRDRMPDNAGFADWSLSAEGLHRSYRALHAGGFRNPLGPLKCVANGACFQIDALQIAEACDHPPGTVFQHGDSIRVACGNNSSVAVTGLTSMLGNSVEPSVLAASREPLRSGPPDAHACEHVDVHRWVPRARTFEVLTLEGERTAVLEPVRQRFRFPVSGKALRERTLLTSAMVFGALAGRTRMSICASDGTLVERSRASCGYVIPWVPIDVDLERDEPLGTDPVSAASASGGFPADFAMRFPEYQDFAAAVTNPEVGVYFAQSQDELKARLDGFAADRGSPRICICACEDDATITIHSAYRDWFVERLPEFLGAAAQFLEHTTGEFERFELIGKRDRDLLSKINDTQTPLPETDPFQQIESLAHSEPDRPALTHRNTTWSYDTLLERSARVAEYLTANPPASTAVGVLMSRSLEAVATMLGIIRAGYAYLPLDPEYPSERIRFIVVDAKLDLCFADSAAAERYSGLRCPLIRFEELDAATDAALPERAVASALAYVIYTSGSTGQPKGVLVGHDNVSNFCLAMDGSVECTDGVMLSVTSISFDISVLELWWSLSRGMHVVLYEDDFRATGATAAGMPAANVDMSLYYWNTAQSNVAGTGQPAYELLLNGARFADQNGFTAIWTPERHFGDFGGLFPNPSVVSAAIAAVTDSVQIRAGSCVLPLHHPIRVAEEWSIVDNLSGGRVGVSFASGWMPNDFVLAPENFSGAKDRMFDGIEQVHALWRGEAVPFEGPNGRVEVRSLPRPVQSELPTWITSAGSTDTFARAGELGFNVLTHLLGQSEEDLVKNIAAYRSARRAAGHDDGHVTLMLHTFVAEDIASAEAAARAPMKAFLKSSLSLIKDATWEFPAFAQFSDDGKRSMDDYFEQISDQDMDDLLEFAFQRYFRRHGLFGDVDRCRQRVAEMAERGVDEIACLIDFGIDDAKVVESLPLLARVNAEPVQREETVFARLVRQYGVTHLQCTPSQARMFLMNADAAAAFEKLDCLLVGGEALPQVTADELVSRVEHGRVINMYGPTETTVWSLTRRLTPGDRVTIGQPIANTTVKILDPVGRTCPIGLTGELHIGGAGVTRGYLNRATLTRERFKVIDGERYYATGDIVRLLETGDIEYLNRNDDQVKLRGYRIELGEVETELARVANVRQVCVMVDRSGDRLTAYYAAKHELDARALRKELGKSLPEYMLPGQFVRVESMPLTPNGKIDRRALADAAVPSTSAGEIRVQGATQRRILTIWQSLLERDDIAVDSNFFDVGGHSILAVRMQGMLSDEFDRRLPISSLFEYPTVGALARHIDSLDEPDSADQPLAVAGDGSVGIASARSNAGISRAQRRKRLRKARR